MRFQLSSSIVLDTDDARVKNQGLRIAVIGESGSGKSWAIAVLAEQAIQQGLQVVFIDPHGEYWTFAEKFDVTIVGGEKGDLILAEECMPVYGEAFKQGKSIDFNLREFMDDEMAYSRIVEKILRTLWKTLVNDPRACLVVFEEAQMVCPQERSNDVMRRVGLVKSIVTGGRKFGASFILGSQRPAELHKTPLSQCWIRFFGKTTERLDREAVEDYLKPFKSNVLKNLRTGQFYIYGWFEQPILVDVTSQRLTRHGGDTPLITQIQRSMKQQASIEEFKRRIEELLQKRKTEEDELKKLRTEKQDLEKRLAEAETKITAMTQRLDELKDIRDMLTPLTEKLQTAQQSGVQVDRSVLASLEELRSRMQALERDLGEGTAPPILDQTTGLIKGDSRTQLLLNKLNPEERMIFLALEQRPCNVANLARQTGLSENRVKNLLEYLRRKKAIRILGRRERRYTGVHGGGIFYATVKLT
jgi:hypothetical protein